MKKPKTKNVMITINSSQSFLGQKNEGAELITEGEYSVGEEGIRLSYMESALTGMEGTRTAFLVTPDEVILSRTGSVTSRMVFHRGEQQHFLYDTDAGSMVLGLNTHSIKTALDEHGGEMEVIYDIDFDKAFRTRNHFKIDVKERNPGS